jgi:hypothetical protein
MNFSRIFANLKALVEKHVHRARLICNCLAYANENPLCYDCDGKNECVE